MMLSVLICTIPGREQMLDRLIGALERQRGENKFIEFVIDSRDRSIPTGVKRNDLIRSCNGNYFVFCDDDDDLHKDYLQDISKSIIDSSPDVVTFNGYMTTNGGARVDWVIKLGEKYEARKDHDGITRYYRFPNHLCVFKKELVKHFTFPPVWQGEDYQWAKAIHDSGVLKTSVHIEKQLYHYKFLTNK